MSDGWVTKNAFTMNISREMALDFGLVEPTPEEKAVRDRRMAEFDARRVEAWQVYDAARPALDAITDEPARSILTLHRWSQVEGPKCEGCDMDGCEAEDPEWPCRTTEAIAAHYGIAIPDGIYLWRRP